MGRVAEKCVSHLEFAEGPVLVLVEVADERAEAVGVVVLHLLARGLLAVGGVNLGPVSARGLLSLILVTTCNAAPRITRLGVHGNLSYNL